MRIVTAFRSSAATLLVAIAAVGGGAGLGLVAVPRVGTFLGMLVGGFLLGVGSETRPLVEGATAAVAAKLLILAAAGVPGLGATGAAAALGSVGTGTLALSLGLSAAAGGFGVHLGDDLRDGLSAPVEGREPAGNPGTRATRTDEATVSDRPSGGEASAADGDADRELVRE